MKPALLAASALALLLAGPAPAAPPLAPLAAALTAQGGSFGTIKGRLVWGGAEAPKQEVLVEKGKAEKDPEVCAASHTLFKRELVVDPKTKGVANAFAYINRPKGQNPEAIKALVEKEPKVELDQKECQFEPYAIALHKGQTLVLKSSDPKGHNVRYNGFGGAALNTVIPPNGTFEVPKFVAAERLPLEVRCDIHPWMKAWMMVFDHPFFAVTEKDGSFEIHGVPAGVQNLIVWQEKVGYATKQGAANFKAVNVKPGETTDVGEIVLDPARVKK